MDLELRVVGLIIAIVFMALLLAFSRRYSRRRRRKAPRMTKINIPCDAAIQAGILDALKRDGVQFIPPMEREPSPGPYSSDPYYLPQNRVCFVLVAESDAERAEAVIDRIHRQVM